VSELPSPGKPFDITKWEVWEAYRQVKAKTLVNKGFQVCWWRARRRVMMMIMAHWTIAAWCCGRRS
jgi:uncharacterized protein (DUF488 family)